jgi:hypothetical protein
MSTFNKKTLVAAVGVALLVSACGGGGGAAGSASSTTSTSSLTVAPSLGQIAAGTKVFLKDHKGSTVTSGTIGSDGMVTLTYDPAKLGAEVFVVQVGDGTTFKYFNEATGQEEDYTGTLSSTAMVSSSNQTVGVSALTEMAYQAVATDLPTLASTELKTRITTEQKQVAKLFLGSEDFDITRAPAILGKNTTGLGTGDAATYAATLAAFAKAAKDAGQSLDKVIKNTADDYKDDQTISAGNSDGKVAPSEVKAAAASLDKLSPAIAQAISNIMVAIPAKDGLSTEDKSAIKDAANNTVVENSEEGKNAVASAKLLLNDLRANLDGLEQAVVTSDMEKQMNLAVLPEGQSATDQLSVTINMLSTGVNIIAGKQPLESYEDNYEGKVYSLQGMQTARFWCDSAKGYDDNYPAAGLKPTIQTAKDMNGVWTSDKVATCQATFPTGQWFNNRPVFSRVYILLEETTAGSYAWQSYTRLSYRPTVNADWVSIIRYPKNTGAGTYSFPGKYATSATAKGNLGYINSYLPSPKIDLGFSLDQAAGNASMHGSISANYQDKVLVQQYVNNNWQAAAYQDVDLSYDSRTDGELPGRIKTLAGAGKAFSLSLDNAAIQFKANSSNPSDISKFTMAGSMQAGDVQWKLKELTIDEPVNWGSDANPDIRPQHAVFHGSFLMNNQLVFDGKFEARQDRNGMDPLKALSASNYAKTSGSFLGTVMAASRPLEVNVSYQQTAYEDFTLALGYKYTNAAGRTVQLAGNGSRVNKVDTFSVNSAGGTQIIYKAVAEKGVIGEIRSKGGLLIGRLYKGRAEFVDGTSVSLG